MKNISIVFTVLSLIVIQSCQKQDLQEKNLKPSSFSELKVSQEFDWNLSKVVSLNVIDEPNQVVKVTSEDEIISYHIGYNTSVDGSYFTKFSIPTYVNMLKVNGQFVEVKDQISIDLTSACKSVKADGYFLDVGNIYEFDFPDSPNENYLAEAIDSNHLIVSYNSGVRLYARYATVTGKEIIQHDRMVISEGFGRHWDLCKISANTIVFCYTITDGEHTKGYAKVGSISGNTISYSEAYQITNADIYDISIVEAGESRFVIAYNEVSDGEIILVEGQYNAGVLSFTSSFMTDKYTHANMPDNAHNTLELTKTIDNKYMLCFFDSQNNDYLSCFIAEINDGNCDLGGVKQIANNSNGYGISLALLDSERAVVSDNVLGSDNSINLIEINEMSISVLDNILVDDDTYSYCNLGRLNDNQFTVSFCRYNLPNNVVPTVNVGTVVSSNISLSAKKQFSNTLSFHAFNFGNSNSLRENKVLLSYRPPDIPGRPTSIAIAEYIPGDNTQDTDGDGVYDLDDAFPDDPTLSFINYYPSGSFGSVAFEDLYPYTGDYDFNDVVIDFRFEMYSGTDNLISKIKGVFVPRASGASFENGFGFMLNKGNYWTGDVVVNGGRLEEGIINLDDNGLEQGQSNPTIIVFDNFFNIIPSVGGIGVNTSPDYTYIEGDTIDIHIDNAIPVATYALRIWEWNPFIFVNGIRGHEVHLPYRPPTDLVDMTTLNVGEAFGDTYKTRTYLPWAIETPSSIDYPIEKHDIINAFNYFYIWAESNGYDYTDWYLDRAGYRNNSNLY